MYEESRWLQRHQNFQRAMYHLDAAKEVIHNDLAGVLSDLQKQGLIKCFEMAFELAWKTLQDYFEEQGYEIGKGPKATIQQAYKDSLIKEGNLWIKMLESRNDAAHAYDEVMANEIVDGIVNTYYALLDDLDRVLTSIKNGLI